MTVIDQSFTSWGDAETGCNLASEKRPEMGRDSGCDMSSSSAADSPSSYRRRINNDDNSTGSLTCSSCDATVDQTSIVYQQLSETLAQARLTNTFCSINANLVAECESSVALTAQDKSDNDQVIKGLDNFALDESDGQADEERFEKPSFYLPDSQPSVPASRKSRGRLLPQVLASLALAIAALIEGYSSGYTSPALASMTQANSSIPVNDQQVRNQTNLLN